MTLSTMALSITAKHAECHIYWLSLMLSVTQKLFNAEWHYAECRYAACCYAEYRSTFSIIMLYITYDVMLSKMALSIMTHNITISATECHLCSLSQKAHLLNVFMMNVVAPCWMSYCSLPWWLRPTIKTHWNLLNFSLKTLICFQMLKKSFLLILFFAKQSNIKLKFSSLIFALYGNGTAHFFKFSFTIEGTTKKVYKT